MARLWNFFEGEPYLDNPRLLILNSKGKRMRTKTRRVRRTNPRRRRTYRRNAFPIAGMVANPRRRRRSPSRRRHHFASNPRRRHHFRRNPPDILGFNFKDIAIAGAAVVAVPFLEKQLMGLLPTSMAGTTSGRWVVKIGSAAAAGFAAKKFLGPKTANIVMLVLGANLVYDAVAEFAPQLITPAGYYTQPLGFYPNRLGQPSQQLFPGNPRSTVENTVIDRLNPASRF